ncbi:MAG TPA: hypothetical protein VF618_16530 [Thermoanaerobaculia bacterium]
MRSTLFLGDLATAVERLAPTDAETERQIAELLGVVAPAVEPQPPGKVGPDETHVSDSSHSSHASDSSEPSEIAFFLTRVESRHSPSQDYVPLPIAAATRTVPDAGGSERDEPRPPLEPLLAPLSTRTILTAALSTPVEQGIDVARTIERVARREPLEALPMKVRPSMRRGMQLLLDRSRGMMPFLADQPSFVRAVARVAGRQRVAAGAFIGSPLRGLTRGLRATTPYAFPARGTPVVLLTDLGITQPEALNDSAGTDEWLRFTAAARQAGCPVIAFVPYPPSRWPLPLRRAMTILQWDRALTAGRARRAVRR